MWAASLLQISGDLKYLFSSERHCRGTFPPGVYWQQNKLKITLVCFELKVFLNENKQRCSYVLLNILFLANENIFALYAVALQNVILSYLIWSFRQGPELFIALWTLWSHHALFYFVFFLIKGLGCKSMLISGIRNLVKNFANESSCALIKGRWTQTLHNISKVPLLLLTHNCPTCLGDTGMSSRDSKKKKKPHPLFCIILSRSREGQVWVIFPVSPSHFVYHSNANLVPLSMREQE